MKAPLKNHKKIVGLLLLVLVFVGCQRSPQARWDRFMASGRNMMDQKDYARAIIQFRNAIQTMPKDAEGYYQLGMAYLGSGDVQGAYASLKRAARLNPSHAGVQLRIAQIQSNYGDPEMVKDAAKRLESLLSRTASDPDTLNTLAFTEMRLGNLSAATQHLEELLLSSPRELVSSVLLANVKLAQNDVNGAEQALKAACANDPKSSDAAVMLGKFYVSRNRGPEAEQQFQRALQLDPSNAAALTSLGLVQDFYGRKQEAEQTFRRLAGLSESNSNYVFGLFLFQENRPIEGVREFERLVKTNPNDRDARTRLVAAYYRVGRTADAETILAKALQKDPRDTSALLQRGEMYLRANKYGGAEADFNQVLHVRPDSPEIHYLLAKLNQARGSRRIYRQELGEALRLNSGILRVRFDLAQSLLEAGFAKPALDLLNEAPESQKQLPEFLAQRNWVLWSLQNLPEMRAGIDAGLARQRTPELLIQDGLYKLRTGQPKEAQKVLEEALQIDPSDLLALRTLNETYQALKEAPMALKKAREYAALQPKSAPVQEFLGELLSSSGDVAGARAAFAAAKAASPEFVQADLSLARLDVLDGQWDVARKRLEAAVNVDDAVSATPRLWLGVIEQIQGDNGKAIQDYRKAIEVNPNEAQALNNLAYLLAENSPNLDEALRYAERSVELAPAHPGYAETLGWILYKKGLYTSAVPYLEKASSASSSAIGKYHLAMAYAKTGDRRSHTVLEAALKVNANLAEAKVAQEVVGSSH